MLNFLKHKLENIPLRQEITACRTNFGNNDYLCLASSFGSKLAGILSIIKYGSGVRASKYIGGYSNLMHELEMAMKSIKNTEDCIIFGSGYLADIGIMQTFDARDTIFIADKLIHASYIDGIKYGKLIRFPHNDIGVLESILKEQGGKQCVIITETVFSMHGDKSPLAEIINLAKSFDAAVISDDAHGFGVIDSYKNVPEYEFHIKMGTFSKAVGSYGGYACGSVDVINSARNLARTQIYSTALPASVIASALYGIKKIAKLSHPSNALLNAQEFTHALGLPQAESAIVLIDFPSESEAKTAHAIFQNEQIYIPLIRPPTLPFYAIRLSFTSKSDVKQLVKTIEKSENLRLLINAGSM